MDQKKDLKAALKNLPEYKAPDSIWDKIESEMNEEIAESPLSIALKKLPVHKPSEEVWGNIEQNLPAQSPNFTVWRNVLGIAASIALAVGFFFWIGNNNPQYDVEYAYAEEILDDRMQFANFETDEEAFEMIEEICSEKSFLCEHTDFKELKLELEELNEAHEELEFAMGEYNTSPELSKELKDIEMERTVVFKRLLAMI